MPIIVVVPTTSEKPIRSRDENSFLLLWTKDAASLDKNVSRDFRLDLIRRKLVTWRIKRHLHYISFLNKPIFKLFKSSTKHLIEFVTDCLRKKRL